ncbi:MAG: bacillithiol biosynthesis cysteine-adding enzyme BshC [Bacteroidetes bacterium]|nr:bacillithiol biosynthesis cysteine-adding enzyme BshC [Bacteroidota bacterium]
MTITSKYISYRETGFFSQLILDYIQKDPALYSLPLFPPDRLGLSKAIIERQQFATNRPAIVAHLKDQYQGIKLANPVRENIESLLQPSTFTITTAHQNNLFTGPLYFFYKILHAIRLAMYCKVQFPELHFVPVFFIGSEDADLEELNHIHVGNLTHRWNTEQKGAVGRMKVDQELLNLIDELAGEWGGLPHGKEWIEMLKSSYQEQDTLARATLRMVDQLFGRFGVVVIDADAKSLKELGKSIFSFDLEAGQTEAAINPTLNQMKEWGYSAQALVRPINLFYLKEGLRQRIEKVNDKWQVVGTTIQFNQQQLMQELEQYPERFSPNVILRGLYQSLLLPDIAFIGGGSELAYWMPLISLHKKMSIPFPVLILRNSFLLVSAEQSAKLAKLGLETRHLFQSIEKLLGDCYTEADKKNCSLKAELIQLQEFYRELAQKAEGVDFSLKGHAEAIGKNGERLVKGMEKKMARAIKQKYSAREKKLLALKTALFPNGKLQERVDHMGTFYAQYGSQLLDHLLEASYPLEPFFTMTTID